MFYCLSVDPYDFEPSADIFINDEQGNISDFGLSELNVYVPCTVEASNKKEWQTVIMTLVKIIKNPQSIKVNN